MTGIDAGLCLGSLQGLSPSHLHVASPCALGFLTAWQLFQEWEFPENQVEAKILLIVTSLPSFKWRKCRLYLLMGKISSVTFRTCGMKDLVAATLESTTCHTAQLGIISWRKACSLTPRDEIGDLCMEKTRFLGKRLWYEVGGGRRIQTLPR